MKNNRSIITVLILIILAIASSIVFIIICRNSKKSVFIDSYDSFPSLKIKDYSNNEININKLFIDSNKDKVFIVYITDQCESCINILDTLSLLSSIEPKNFEVVIFWDDNIPVKLLEEKKLGIENSYSLSGKYIIKSIKPYMYVVDTVTNVVSLKSGDFNGIVNYLVDSIDYQQIKESIKEFFDSEILIFKTFSCEACTNIENTIDSLGDEIQYSMISDSIEINDYFYDKASILRSIYSVEKYPAYVDLSNNEVVYDIKEIFQN